jgi:hypothetical protein
LMVVEGTRLSVQARYTTHARAVPKSCVCARRITNSTL